MSVVIRSRLRRLPPLPPRTEQIRRAFHGRFWWCVQHEADWLHGLWADRGWTGTVTFPWRGYTTVGRLAEGLADKILERLGAEDDGR